MSKTVLFQTTQSRIQKQGGILCVLLLEKLSSISFSDEITSYNNIALKMVFKKMKRYTLVYYS